MKKIIGIAGNARSGKDTVGHIIHDICVSKGKRAKVVSFAAALRAELDSFCMTQLGISAYTTDDAEKKILRPLLVCWGTEIRRAQAENYWIEALKQSMNDEETYYIITDLRFLNEMNWIKKNCGVTIYLDRASIAPANYYEKENNAILEKLVDYVWEMPTTRDMDVLTKYVEKIYLHSFKNIL